MQLYAPNYPGFQNRRFQGQPPPLKHLFDISVDLLKPQHQPVTLYSANEAVSLAHYLLIAINKRRRKVRVDGRNKEFVYCSINRQLVFSSQSESS